MNKRLKIKDLEPGNLYSFYWGDITTSYKVNVYMDPTSKHNGDGYIDTETVCFLIAKDFKLFYNKPSACLKILLPDRRIRYIFVADGQESNFYIIPRG